MTVERAEHLNRSTEAHNQGAIDQVEDQLHPIFIRHRPLVIAILANWLSLPMFPAKGSLLTKELGKTTMVGRARGSRKRAFELVPRLFATVQDEQAADPLNAALPFMSRPRAVVLGWSGAFKDIVTSDCIFYVTNVRTEKGSRERGVAPGVEPATGVQWKWVRLP
ncbi:hypothetical protein RGCCGE502_09425 [Rhizobium grahamii CCGE 502]|uniref:Uncharacterized protein n=1 Tax=Rhizobium grahamii CCGE 502 TaxID=990285 RepID=S3I081_9HYPH|nr:hypothetical protein RGCCGE502_09425 [Rhizobium grahamii CCGE 502]